jgi:hypothetical protein
LENAPLWRTPSLRTASGWSLLLCLLGTLITFLPWYRKDFLGFVTNRDGARFLALALRIRSCPAV